MKVHLIQITCLEIGDRTRQDPLTKFKRKTILKYSFVCVCGRKLKQNAKVEMERRKKNASEISVGVMLRSCTPRLGSRRMLYHPSRFTPAKPPKNPLALLQFSRAVSPTVTFED